MKRKNYTKRNWYVIDANGEIRGEIKGGETIKAGIGAERKYNGAEYIKKYEADAEMLLRDNLSCYWLLGYLTRYVEPRTNLLKVGFQKLTNCDIAREIGVSRQTVSRRLGLLIERGLLGKFYLDRRTYYVMNPQYYSKGQTIPKEIWRLFNAKAVEDGKPDT